MKLGRSRTPLHLWAIGVLGLAWSAFGAVDYVMTNVRDPEYLAQFPAETIQMIDEFPVWVMAAWSFGVWGAVAGSLLLLLRSRFAVHAFALSLAGLAARTVYQAGLDMPEGLPTPAIMVMDVLIWAGALLLLAYAVWMRRRGVLR